MKTWLFSVFLSLILISSLLPPNTFAQDYIRWELPEGAIARLGKGGISMKYNTLRTAHVSLWQVVSVFGSTIQLPFKRPPCSPEIQMEFPAWH